MQIRIAGGMRIIGQKSDFTVKCAMCGRVFKSLASLEYHKSNKHNSK